QELENSLTTLTPRDVIVRANAFNASDDPDARFACCGGGSTGCTGAYKRQLSPASTHRASASPNWSASPSDWSASPSDWSAFSSPRAPSSRRPGAAQRRQSPDTGDQKAASVGGLCRSGVRLAGRQPAHGECEDALSGRFHDVSPATTFRRPIGAGDRSDRRPA